MTDISNSADIIDSRDIIARIEELEGETHYVYGSGLPGCLYDNSGTAPTLADAVLDVLFIFERAEGDSDEQQWAIAAALVDAKNTLLGGETYYFPTDLRGVFGAGMVEVSEQDGPCPDTDEAEELRVLKKLADQCEGYGDWEHGETLIHEDHFKAYAQELAEDTGAIDRNAKWPRNHIDWDAACQELKQDYTEVDYDGQTYYMRS